MVRSVLYIRGDVVGPICAFRSRMANHVETKVETHDTSQTKTSLVGPSDSKCCTVFAKSLKKSHFTTIIKYLKNG